MSTKKDKFTLKDKNYMRLAINLARSRKGLTGDNPSVGCVIVKKDEIISIGITSYNGRPHAESNAIKNSFQNLKNSKMYLTLEPCNHYGKTSPCTNKIIKSGINEVYYSVDDIDLRVKGKSLNILSKKNIKVKKGLLKEEALKLYDSYIVNKTRKLPFVSAKIAISKNKLIYSQGIKRITNNTTDKFTHFLRFKNDGIMISSRTLNIDNPKLNCRLKGYENFSPKRIILDKNLEINLKSYVFRSIKEKNTIIFHSSKNNTKLKILRKKGAILIETKLNKKNRFNLNLILKKLFILGIRNLLIEGGNKITKDLIEKKLANNFYLIKSSKILSKNKKYLSFTSLDILDRNYKIKKKLSSKLEKDIINIYKR